jgi:hypothetical protein
MPPTDELAAFQAALLDLLAQDLPPEAMQRRLREDAAFAGYQAYVQGFEPRMLAVAVELVKKWGKPMRGPLNSRQTPGLPTYRPGGEQ